MKSSKMKTISGVKAGRASSDDSKETVQLFEPCIKVNWTIHGGGSDGYYYRRDKWNNMQHDFVNVKDLFEHINTELGKISGKEGRTINSLKIFRWTSPGASIVSNIDIDNQFREIFEHPLWYRFYINKQYASRGCLGAKVPHKGKTVGTEAGVDRGPGELLKDMQLFMYKNGDEKGDIFLNELLSTEYASKYTQTTSDDFGLWMAREDGEYGDLEYFDNINSFRQHIPDEWMPGKDSNQRKTALGNFHKDIFEVGGVGASLPDRKMTDVITEIIIKSSEIIDDEDEWDNICQNWEFFPVTCSPMMGVEGRKELLKVEKQKEIDKDKINEEDDNGNRIRYARLNANPGLWFVYLLNVAKRCWIFHTGKETRDKWQCEQNGKYPIKDTTKYVTDMNPKDFIFEDSYDCLDPAERKQLYEDINGFCQNIRPNSKRQLTRVFNDVPVFDALGAETQLSYDLFDNGGLLKFMDVLSNPDAHTYLDQRDHFMNKIERDWIEGEKILDQIINFVDAKQQEIAPEYDATNVPFVLKILFYVIYNASHVEDGIAKDYGMQTEPPIYVFKGAKRTDDDDRRQSAINKSMTSEWGWFNSYRFTDAINGFIKGIAGKLWNVHDDYGAQRMADGVATNIESSLRDKGPLPVGKYNEWQEGGKAYSYLQYACVRKRNIDQEVKHQIMMIAPTLEPGTFKELSKKLKQQVLAKVSSLPNIDIKWFEGTYTKLFAQFVKDDITKKNARTKLAFNKGTFEKVQNGGKKRKKRRRKKRTRRKRKIKLKWSRKRKKPKKKKIIRIKIKNKTTRNYIKVKKLAKKKRKKRTRRRRKR